MVSELEQKNKFVVGLRDYLMQHYGTEIAFVLGDSDSEVKCGGGGYGLVLRDPEKPKDLGGVFLRKDLCGWRPQDKQSLYKDILEFASGYSSMEVTAKSEDSITIRFGKEEYLLIPHLGEGYADEFGATVFPLSDIQRL